MLKLCCSCICLSYTSIFIIERLKMTFRFWLLFILLIEVDIVDKHVMCAKDTHTGEQGMRENRQRNIKQQSEVPTTARNKNVDDDMLTRVKNMEKNINELMTYVEDIM